MTSLMPAPAPTPATDDPTRTIRLLFCDGDPETGLSTGFFEFLEVGSRSSPESVLSLEGQRTRLAVLAHNVYQVGPISFNGTHSPWVGNWCWNMLRVSTPTAIKILSLLLSNGFTADEGDTELVETWPLGEGTWLTSDAWKAVLS